MDSFRQRLNFSSFIAPRGLGLLLGILLVLWPVIQPQVKRNTDMDIVRLKTAICEYKGIRTSFEELTSAYTLKIYKDPELISWQANTNPTNPTETLITALFQTSGPLEDIIPAPKEIMTARLNATPLFGISWCLNDLGAMRISAYNNLAIDALTIYRKTVEDFLAQMVIVTQAAELRATRDPRQPSVAHISPGTILLQERQEGLWIYLRIPSSSTGGWLKKSLTMPLKP